MKRIGFIIFTIVFIFRILPAQDTISKSRGTELSVKVCYGFIADVGNRNHLLIQSHITPLDISVSQPNSKRYSWQTVLPFAEKGIAIRFADLENPEYLGNIWVFTPYIKVPVFDTKYWRLKIRASLGLLYASKIYHRTANYRNTIFGSHLNTALGFGLENSFFIFHSIVLSAGIDFAHYSNGETTQPNDGMNIGTIFLSTGYQFNKQSLIQTIPNAGFYRKKYLSVIPVAGWKDISPVKSKKYLTSGLSAELGFSLTKLQNIGAGAVVFYDGSMESLYLADIEQGMIIENQYREFTTGLYLFHEVNFYPLLIHLEAGYYLIDQRIEGRSRIFNRFGIRYFIADNIFFNFTHKSHFFFKGDNLEWGIGYIF